MNINKQIFYTTVILMFTIVLFGITDLDLVIQDYFYNFTTHSWIVNRDAQPYKFIFYDGAKKLLIFIAILALFSLLFIKFSKIIREYKKGIIIFVLSAIFVPFVTITLKRYTNMPCPKNEIHYNGTMIRTAVWEQYPLKYARMPHIKCWPAGHASAGFALLSLFFFFKTRRNRFIALGSALTIGWIMGLYKMLIGDHFLSHTVITMILAWLIILIIVKITNKKQVLYE